MFSSSVQTKSCTSSLLFPRHEPLWLVQEAVSSISCPPTCQPRKYGLKTISTFSKCFIDWSITKLLLHVPLVDHSWLTSVDISDLYIMGNETKETKLGMDILDISQHSDITYGISSLLQVPVLHWPSKAALFSSLAQEKFSNRRYRSQLSVSLRFLCPIQKPTLCKNSYHIVQNEIKSKCQGCRFVLKEFSDAALVELPTMPTSGDWPRNHSYCTLTDLWQQIWAREKESQMRDTDTRYLSIDIYRKWNENEASTFLCLRAASISLSSWNENCLHFQVTIALLEVFSIRACPWDKRTARSFECLFEILSPLQGGLRWLCIIPKVFAFGGAYVRDAGTERTHKITSQNRHK